jgi:hypothetical protein
MKAESKYDVAKEYYRGVAAVFTGTARLLSESDHWLAGWDAGYSLRPRIHLLLNQYLTSVGHNPVDYVRFVSAKEENNDADAADTAEIIRQLQERIAESHDWQCGCGHWNGANLDHCGDCGRTPYDTRRAMETKA